MLCCQDFICLSTSSRTFRVDSTHTIYQLLTDSTGPNLVLSGRRNSTSMYSQGTDGNYWSRTANNNNLAYYLGFNTSNVYPGTGNDVKYGGFTVRCVAGS